MDSHTIEVDRGQRFEFGANWQRFLRTLNDEKIEAAVASVREMLGDLKGKTFLDIGSGSGLFSLAAHKLGARVRSFDYDPQSVACTEELSQRYGPWTVERGSALDEAYMAQIGKFDTVYSWGVLHHTGSMWHALGLAGNAVADGGRLFVAIYNDQGWRSSYWKAVKRLYNHDAVSRALLIATHAPIIIGGRYASRLVRGRVPRGMSIWYDFFDWMGGYPFEVANADAITRFFEARGFRAERVVDVGTRSGCNEHVFTRVGT